MPKMRAAVFIEPGRIALDEKLSGMARSRWRSRREDYADPKLTNNFGRRP